MTYKEYRQQCRFKFDPDEFVEEFDLEMIEDFGWYGPDNPTGVSKDHMLSISYGWKEHIPPAVIRHPANCRLMIFEDNRRKGRRSSVNYAGLLSRIQTWSEKYK